MLNSYIIIPFIFAIVLCLCVFLKNPIYIRRFAKILYTIYFGLTCVIFFFFDKVQFSILNLSFEIDEYSKYFVFLAGFIFFLFSIISKKFISKLHKLFYSTSFLLLGLINIAILTNNIFVLLVTLFWIFLLCYFLSISFSKECNKKDINFQLTNYIFWFVIACGLIFKDFIRYFIVNDIEFSFINLSLNLYKIEESSAILAFFGFLIIIGCLFNFYPFNSKNLSNASKTNSCVFSLCTINSSILGCYLLLRCYLKFDYLFFQFQDAISIYLLVNFLIYLLLIFKQKHLFKFLVSIFCACYLIGVFSIFSFEKECSYIFLYCSLVISVSYCLSAFVFMFLKDKFQTDEIDEFKKIEDKTKVSQFFVFVSLLNMSFVPLLPIFSAQLICLLLMFSTDFEGIILNIVPYILLIGIFLMSLSSLNVLYKILIAPVEKSKTNTTLCNHQILVCTLLIFVMIVWEFFLKTLLSN